MRKIYSTSGFTLIEVIVSISIMSVILIAIMGVFFSMSDLSNKTEIQRQLQTNVKNSIEIMAEDIRIHGIQQSDCEVLGAVQENYWCNNNGDKYYLGKTNESGGFTVALDSYCSEPKNNCYLLKNGVPLNNSYLSVKTLQFDILGSESIPRLSINMVVQPATGRGVKSYLISKNTLILQTTLSESFLKQ